MTDHQIAYNRLLEERRANRAKEAETFRSNLATESLKAAEIEEKNRAARAGELETMRHNQAYEDETQRHNYATEMNQVYGVDVNAGLGYSQVGLGYSQLNESKRANLRNEELTEWRTSAENAYKSAMAAANIKRNELTEIGNELKARELDLSEERFELEKEYKRKEIELKQANTVVDSASKLLLLVPSLSNVLTLLENSVYGI